MTLTPRYEQEYYEVVLQHLNQPFYLRYCHRAHPIYVNIELQRLLRHLDADATQFEPLSPENSQILMQFLDRQPADLPLVEVPLQMTPLFYLVLSESPIFTTEGVLIGFVGSVKLISKDESHHLTLVNRLSFEKALSQISAALVNPHEDFDITLHQCLEILAKFSGASRAYIFLFRDANQFMDNTHEWCAQGVSSEKDNLQDIPTSEFGWWMKKISDNEIIYIKALSELPPSESYLAEVLAAQQISSLIALPLMINGSPIGYVGLDNVNAYDIWHSEDFALLKFTATLFSAAIERKQFVDALNLNNLNLSQTLNELRTLQAQMIQQEKMVGIGQLAAGIAHEINNPLGYVASNLETLTKYIVRLETVIRDYLQLTEALASDAEPKAIKAYKEKAQQIFKQNKIDFVLNDLNELIEDSKNGFQRVSNIIMSLRNFARTDANARHEGYNLAQIIDEVLQILGNEIKYAASVVKEVDPYMTLTCNRTEIGQVILNLVLNGIQAIKSSPQFTTGTITIRAYPEGNRRMIEIQDDGVGMSEEVLSHIFDPFFTTKEIGTGTGLGLSITYDIVVNKHHGKINVNSELGKGTCFVLEFITN